MTADLQEAPAIAAFDEVTLELACEDSGILARRHTRQCLCTWQLEHLVSDAMQIVMELVANVMEHTNSTSVTVGLALHRGLLIEVTDYDPRQLPIVLPEQQGDVLAEGGRGLRLVAALSTAHGVLRAPDGGGLTRFAVIEVA